MSTELVNFRIGLEPLLVDARTRPFVCSGSPLACRSFVVGFNAATTLKNPFVTYWSDEGGFDRAAFDADYGATRSRHGNRPVIEAVSAQIGPCLETNLYAIPTAKAKQLTDAEKALSTLPYLFRVIRPQLVFVHSNEPIKFFEEVTRCTSFTTEVARARWQGHEFLLHGRRGPLYTLGAKKGAELGKRMAEHLG